MYKKSEPQTRVFMSPVPCNQNDSYGHVISSIAAASGSDLIRNELGAYGDKILGSGSQYFHNSIGRYLSKLYYYFQVNDDYVKNKLKVVLFPFLHKGHWMRAVEPDGGKLSYKPPIHDINAPDLYIPIMAFGTYIILSGFFLGINGKFSPESLGVQFTTGLLCWLLQVLLLEGTLLSLGGGEVALLDMVSYAGYIYVAATVILGTRMVSDYLFCAAALWEGICMAILMKKTMKRILISEVPSFEKNSTKRICIMLFMAASQFPLLYWLGNVGVQAT